MAGLFTALDLKVEDKFRRTVERSAFDDLEVLETADDLVLDPSKVRSSRSDVSTRVAAKASDSALVSVRT